MAWEEIKASQVACGVLEGATSRNASGTGMLGSKGCRVNSLDKNFEVKDLTPLYLVAQDGHTTFLFCHFNSFAFCGVFELCLG